MQLKMLGTYFYCEILLLEDGSRNIDNLVFGYFDDEVPDDSLPRREGPGACGPRRGLVLFPHKVIPSFTTDGTD